MVILNVSAFTIMRLFGGFGVFHFFALLSLVSLAFGVAAVVLRRPRSNWLYFHYQWMAWSYAGLLGATINEALCISTGSVRMRGRRTIRLFLSFK